MNSKSAHALSKRYRIGRLNKDRMLLRIYKSRANRGRRPNSVYRRSEKGQEMKNHICTPKLTLCVLEWQL